MNNYKSFSELKEELGNNYDFKLYEMGISALKEIENLQQENKQLKDNWNKLKDYIKTEIPEDVFIDTEWFVSILDIMQEIEKESNSNAKD